MAVKVSRPESPNEDKENNHRQMHQHLNLQALTNTHTRADWAKVCVCHSECGHCISCTDLLQVSINHGRPTSHARSKALSQQYTEKWLFISTALYSHKLLTIDFAPARTNTQQHGQTDTHWAACKSTLNTCHNKELPATKRREKYRPTPHAAHKTHTHTLFWLVNCTASSD